MKIGTLTTHMADNYGAVLQAYALHKRLRKDTDCEIINYYPDYVADTYHKQPRLRNIKDCINFAFRVLYGKKRESRRHKFEAFRDKYYFLSPICKDMNELRALSSKYDAIIAGSDQIWNPEIHNFDEAYFLTFCSKDIKKYGYAPSFGVSELTEEQAEAIKKRCEGFRKIAFREKSGIKIAEKILGIECPLVLDPVFLLDKSEWRNIMASRIIPGKYVLCYFLSDPKDSVAAICEKYRQKNMDVISIGFSVRDVLNSAKKMYDVGPLEFLSLIAHAEIVITDSFHATAFSVLFEKSFYTRIDGKNAKRADRIYSLLSTVDLMDRAYSDKDMKNMILEDIDYENIKGKVSSAINRSEDFIREILVDI